MEFTIVICPYCDSPEITEVDYDIFECDECRRDFDLSEANTGILRVEE